MREKRGSSVSDISESVSKRPCILISDEDSESPCDSPIVISNKDSECASDSPFIISDEDSEFPSDFHIVISDEDSECPSDSPIVISDEDSEFPSDLPIESAQDELNSSCQTKKCIPHFLIRLMYQLDLSVLCFLRKFRYKHKYPSLSVAFENSEVDKFSNITLCFQDEYIHVQIEYVNKYYTDSIGYMKLFDKEKGDSYIDNCFNSFIEHQINKVENASNNIEYFVIYTNSGLDITEENVLKQRKSRNFYPFKFDVINVKECDILKDFFLMNDDKQKYSCYQFSKYITTREELLKRLEFSSTMQEVMKERSISRKYERRMKKEFLDRLVFVVNQPNREELNRIVKSEIENNRKIKADYSLLQERVLYALMTPKKHTHFVNSIPEVLFKFNLFISFLHDMFLNKSMTSVYSENNGIHNDITICYKGKITYIKPINGDSCINYSQLFHSETQDRKSTFAINKHFDFFIEELEKGNNIKYFIIYTDVGIDLTEDNIIRKGKSKDFIPLKLNSIDILKKKYKILRHSSCMNEIGLYQFSLEENKKLSSLLKVPPSFRKEKLSDMDEKEIIETFLHKLVFAVNQPNMEKLKNIIKNEIENKSNLIPYNYEELYEVALRCSESHEMGLATKEIMIKLLGAIKHDICYNNISYQEIQNENFDDEIKFAKYVIRREGTLTFNLFLDFLTKGEGIKHLEVLKRNGINLSNMSGILCGAGSNAQKAFKGLYDLWFDERGNKTQYLKTLEKEGINLSSMSSILAAAGGSAVIAFKELYELWFDEQGNKTRYLKTLEKEGVRLCNMSSILSLSRANAAKCFKDLYNIWFDAEGNKTRYLKTLEKEKISLSKMSCILGGSKGNAAKAFKDLYNLWFDAEGNKTEYLKTLEKEGINLSSMSNILRGARSNATKAFKDLYDLWFDGERNKTGYLKALEKEGVNLSNMSGILGGTGAKAAKCFKDLYNIWFDAGGNKTLYLKTLEKERISLSNMSNILAGARANAAKAFKGLYDLWFDAKGNKTGYLKTLEKEGVNLSNMSCILGGTGAKAEKCFKDLYNIWFDEQGNKTQYLKTLEKEGIDLSNMSSILAGARANAAKAFKGLYDLWFDAKGNKTGYLKTLEKEGIILSSMSSILSRSGANAATAFVNLYNTFFDERGNKKQHLKHFIDGKDTEKYFTMQNLSCILCGAGVRAKEAFENLHSVCFNEKGRRTQLLDDFYNAGFKPSNLSTMLSRSGARASTNLKKLHSASFNKERDKKKSFG